ncbi:hypothetical protein F4805DRAFT_400745 [Annulohypoxylon moriforme]|nr:hypothetical protein F4805DRAFT_400745 [Annulohypoxylon moriforme]
MLDWCGWKRVRRKTKVLMVWGWVVSRKVRSRWKMFRESILKYCQVGLEDRYVLNKYLCRCILGEDNRASHRGARIISRDGDENKEHM